MSPMLLCRRPMCFHHFRHASKSEIIFRQSIWRMCSTEAFLGMTTVNPSRGESRSVGRRVVMKETFGRVQDLILLNPERLELRQTVVGDLVVAEVQPLEVFQFRELGQARVADAGRTQVHGEEFFDPGAKYHVPGNTPYVRSEADLSAFLQRIDQYLDFFTGEVGGRGATPFEVKALAEQWSPPSRSAPN